MFEMKFKNRDFQKNKLRDICFSTLKSWKKNLSETESIALK